LRHSAHSVKDFEEKCRRLKIHLGLGDSFILKITEALNKYLYLVLPCFAGLAGWIALQDNLPNFMGQYGYDPSYVYLVNGLNILTGHAPMHVDHPGTPLQCFVGICIILTWAGIHLIGITFQYPAAAVFENPELFIAVISHALLLLNVGALAFVGQRINRATDSLFLMFAIQSTPFIFTHQLYSAILPRMSFLAPEALLIFASNCLIGVLAWEFFHPDRQDKGAKIDRAPLLAGAICGFAIAVKITFLPIVFLLVVLRTRSRIVVSVTAALVTLIVCLLPAASQLPRMFSWFGGIISHTGLYASGGAGVFDFEAMPNHFDLLYESFPFFFVIAIAIAVVILIILYLRLKRSDMQTPSYIVPVTLFMVMFLQTVAVLKHYSPHYLLPALPVSMIGLVWLIFWLSSAYKPGIVSRLIQPASLIILIYLGVSTTAGVLTELRYNKEQAVQRHADISRLIESTPNLLLVGSYQCELKKYAISFALGYSGFVQKKAASPYISDFVEYNIWNKKFMVITEKSASWKGSVYLVEPFHDGKNIIICATQRDFVVEGVLLEPLLKAGKQTFYRVIDVDAHS